VPLRRSDIVDAENPGVYHCISRCVRKESLLTSHARRSWIVTRLQFLAERLAIDVVSFAVMQNHLHLLLRIRPDIVRTWSDRDVAERRLALLPNRRQRTRRGVDPDSRPTDDEVAALLSCPRLLRRARADLSSLGFFHRLLKEPCARAWNREDGVTGHFWEGRYLSPRVLDGASLLRVARYIELNEIRACAADSIPSSVWTSARRQWDRLRVALRSLLESDGGPIETALERVEWEPVFPCAVARDAEGSKTSRDAPDVAQRTTLAGYIATLEAVGRARHPAKPGRIRRAVTAVAEAREDVRAFAATRAGPTIRARAQQLVAALDRYCAAADVTSCCGTGTTPGAINVSLLGLRARGTCYGDAPALAAEARRRGLLRVMPIRFTGEQ
jgi:hypothetical protein